MGKNWPQYEIRIRGHLSPQRFRNFEGLTVCPQAGGETLIVGQFRDQSALYGLLSWLQMMAVTLLLVRREDPPNGCNTNQAED